MSKINQTLPGWVIPPAGQKSQSKKKLRKANRKLRRAKRKLQLELARAVGQIREAEALIRGEPFLKNMTGRKTSPVVVKSEKPPAYQDATGAAVASLYREAQAARLAEAAKPEPGPEKPTYAHLFVNPYTR